MTVQLLKKIHNTISYPIFFYELQLNIDDYKNEFIYTINIVILITKLMSKVK